MSVVMMIVPGTLSWLLLLLLLLTANGKPSPTLTPNLNPITLNPNPNRKGADVLGQMSSDAG